MNFKKTVILVLATLSASAVFADDMKVFKSKCGACHKFNPDAKGAQGPDLSGFAALKRPDGYLDAYLKNPAEARSKFKSIYDAELKGKYQFTMPKVNLKEDEIKAIQNVLK